MVMTWFKSPLSQFLVGSLVILKGIPVKEPAVTALCASLAPFMFFFTFSIFIYADLEDRSNDNPKAGVIYLIRQSIEANIIPTSLVTFLSKTVKENVYKVMASETHSKNVIVMFFFIPYASVLGVTPYSFVITAQIAIPFIITSVMFVSISLTITEHYKEKTFSLFLPINCDPLLSLLLTPIELLSHISKPISLAVRLFINLMAGHSLLKVIMGFGWNMLDIPGNLSFTCQLLPIIAVTLLFGLETSVACIQSYVFITLSVLEMSAM